MLASGKAALAKIGWGLSIDNFVVSFGANIGSALTGKSVIIEYLSPPPPAGGGGGGSSAGALSLAHDGKFIARTADRDGYLVDSTTGLARRIEDGNTFNCYATRIAVADFVQSLVDQDGTPFLNLDPAGTGGPVEIIGGWAPTCLSTPFITWDYSPPPAGNTPFNVILRGQEDGTGFASALADQQLGRDSDHPQPGHLRMPCVSQPRDLERPVQQDPSVVADRHRRRDLRTTHLVARGTAERLLLHAWTTRWPLAVEPQMMPQSLRHPGPPSARTASSRVSTPITVMAPA